MTTTTMMMMMKMLAMMKMMVMRIILKKNTHPRQDYYHATGNVNLYQVIHRSSLEVQFHFQA